jgi:hypothetical protein
MLLYIYALNQVQVLRLRIGNTMDSNYIAVPFRNNTLSMTIVEAQRLQNDLQKQLEQVIASKGGIRPLQVSEDGFIDHEAFTAFFAQVYADGFELNRHVGKLFKPLVRVALYDDVPFVVKCKLCNGVGTIHCGRAYDFHMDVFKSLKLEAASLKEHRAKFLDDYIRSVGPMIKEDFRTLLSYL